MLYSALVFSLISLATSISSLDIWGSVFPNYGAPQSRLERSIIPEADSQYYLGTTSPTTVAWLKGVFDELCLTADTCQTAWPVGGGGSGSNWTPVGGTAFLRPTTTIGTIVSASSTFTQKLNMNFASSTMFSSTYASSTRLFAGLLSIGSSSPAFGPFTVDVQGDEEFGVYTGSRDNFMQLALWNRNAGNSASTDLVLTGAKGSPNAGIGYYFDCYYNGGLAYNVATYSAGGPDDAGCYNNDGDLLLGTISTNSASSTIKFHTGGGTAADVKAVIDINGRFGIGTTSPYAKLSVVGDIVAARFVATTSVASIFPYASSTAITVSGTASTSKFFADGLTNCNTGNMLTWNAGTFGCEDDSTGGGGGQDPFTHPSSSISATTSEMYFTGGLLSTASTTLSGNATTTGDHAFGQIRVPLLTSALLVTDANGLFAEYGGSSTCTNQAVTAFSALGAVTCSSINNSWWSGADLAVANGGTGVSTFGGVNHILYTTAADTLASEAAFTYDGAANRITAENASTTAQSSAYASSTRAFFGLLSVGSSSPFWGPFTVDVAGDSEFAYFGGLRNSFMQLALQNRSNGSDASTDITLNNDLGSPDGAKGYYMDCFINSSTYNAALYSSGGPNDAGCYNNDGNFAIGTASTTATNASLQFVTGGFTLANIRSTILGNGFWGVGTTTPKFSFQIASSTAPQLTLTGSASNDHWSFRNAGGILYIATSSRTTFATSTLPALRLQSGTPALGIASSTFSGQLGIGPITANGSSTIATGKWQIDGYNSAGTRSCTFLVGTTMITVAGLVINNL